MTLRNITESYLQKRHKKEGKAVVKALGNGLNIRISNKGTIAFVFRYTDKGKEKTKSIGAYPVVSLLEAFELAHGLKRAEKAGELALEVKRKPLTVEQVFDQYIEENYRHSNNARNTKSMGKSFIKHLPKALRDTDVDRVTAKTWEKLFFAIAEETPAASKKLLGVLKGAIRKAEKSETIAKNKLQWFTPKDFNIIQVPNTRFFKEDEIGEFFKKLNSDTYCEKKAIHLKLLLLLGCRQGELRKSLWTDFDQQGDGGKTVWVIEKYKTVKKRKGKPIIRIVGALAREYLARMAQLNPHTSYYWGNPQTDLPRTEDFDRKFCMQLQMDKPFTLRTLRHTFITHAAKHIKRDARLRLTGHKFETIDDVYNHELYLTDMEEGLKIWESRLIELGINK